MTDIIRSEAFSQARWWAAKFPPTAIRCAWVAGELDDGEFMSEGVADSLESAIGEAMDALAVQHHAYTFTVLTEDGRFFSGRYKVAADPAPSQTETRALRRILAAGDHE